MTNCPICGRPACRHSHLAKEHCRQAQRAGLRPLIDPLAAATSLNPGTAADPLPGPDGSDLPGDDDPPTHPGGDHFLSSGADDTAVD